jgi:hypothetical protein
MSKLNNDVALLVTATITPQVDYIIIKDSKERLNQYLTAINWYLQNTPYKVIIGENSGYNQLVSYLPSKYRERVEFICYNQEKEDGRNHGYYEWDILRHVYQCSQSVKNTSIIFKITGRLILKNICTIINSLDKNDKAFIAGNMYRTSLEDGYFNIDTRFFAFSTNLYNNILSVQNIVGDDYIYCLVERAMSELVKKFILENTASFVELRQPFVVRGCQANHNVVYDFSVIRLVMAYIYRLYYSLIWHYVYMPRLKCGRYSIRLK